MSSSAPNIRAKLGKMVKTARFRGKNTSKNTADNSPSNEFHGLVQ